MRPGQPAKPRGEFGERLFFWRRQSRPGAPDGWTREKAAEALGLSAQTLDKWEQGRALPSRLAAERLADVAPELVLPDAAARKRFAVEQRRRKASTSRKLRALPGGRA